MFNKLAKFTLPLVFGLFALICLPALLAKADAPPQISAVAAVVIDQASGKVLYDKDMNAEHYPASTTKVLTALLTLENMDIDDKITLPEDYVNVGETSIGLKAGARQTVEELLMALMLYSANDAGQALAIGVAGTEEAFVEMMNEEALSLGATNTHFVNPHGLSHEEHYTTAYDIYLIMNEAIKYDMFNEIISMAEYTTVYNDRSGNAKELNVKNSNAYLSGAESPSGVTVVGGKTGTTSAARNCLALLVRDTGGNPYISVILRAETRDVLYEQMTQLLSEISN